MVWSLDTCYSAAFNAMKTLHSAARLIMQKRKFDHITPTPQYNRYLSLRDDLPIGATTMRTEGDTGPQLLSSVGSAMRWSPATLEMFSGRHRSPTVKHTCRESSSIVQNFQTFIVSAVKTCKQSNIVFKLL